MGHPTVSVHADLPDGLPGRELIVAGLDDLRSGRDTVEAMLVAPGAPRLRACGVDVPGGDRPDSGLRMYRGCWANATPRARTARTTRCAGD